MIQVSVDEAFAYDLLAILMVKGHKGGHRSVAINDSRWRLEGELEGQSEEDPFTGREMIDRHHEIRNSPEFRALYDANLRTFELIDEIKRNPALPAKAVDDCNYERYQCKCRLQERFFPGQPLSERKMGYDGPGRNTILLDNPTNPNTMGTST